MLRNAAKRSSKSFSNKIQIQLSFRRYQNKQALTPWSDYVSSQPSNSMLNQLICNKGYINGEWVSSVSGETYDVLDPASGELITEVPEMSTQDTQLAIESALNAKREFENLTASYRCDLSYQIYLLLLQYQEEIAHIITGECGKPLSESMGEVNYSASFFKWFAEEGKRTYGEIIPTNNNNKRLHVIKQGVGLCGIITPWNFPLAMIARKLAPAIVTGCPSIIKPAQDTPLSALLYGKLADQIGIPKGIINILPSQKYSADIGKELCSNKMVRKISFTGSTRTGIILTQQAASTMKRVSMELGGNAPFIVFDDCDINNAIEGALVSKYRNAGQTCVCTNRFYVHEKVHDEFVEKYINKTKELENKVGHGFNNETKIGPLINKMQFDKVSQITNQAKQSSNNEVVYGGEPVEIPGLDAGYFYKPTIVVSKDNTSNNILHEEEVFGPVSSFFKFNDENEVIEMANNTDMGLASYFYTNNIGRAIRISEQLEYGMVGVNSGLISSEIAPFGGVKFSGIGREGSKHGIDEYLNIKYICYDNVNS